MDYEVQVPVPVPVPVPMEITADPTICRVVIENMVKVLNEGPKSRPVSLAVTKLEEASMWLNEALRLS